MNFYEEYPLLNLTEYKTYHESFMQNNRGSTLFHTFSCILFTVQCSLLVSVTKTSKNKKYYLAEYFIIIFPLICIHTLLSNIVYELNLLLFLLLIYKLLQIVNLNIIKIKLNQTNILDNRNNCITFIRGLTYLITTFCILAVDFKAFPRHLAKTEQYGYSLMDTGVGLFVLISGLVHKDLRNHNLMHILRSNFKFISILLVLGLFRLVSIKQLDYPEHVTEYGVHWNFFFTLAVCKVLSTVVLHLTDRILILSLSVLILHEVLLYYVLEDWVFNINLRDTFLSANKEGISSILGYVALYLFGAHIKTILNNKNIRKLDVLSYLSLISLITWVYLKSFEEMIPPSRTLANFTYCLYLEAIFVTVLVFLYFFEIILNDEKLKNIHYVPCILKEINRNGLLYFILSNIFTGAINMSVRTMFVSKVCTQLILNFYMIITVCIIIFLNNEGV